MNENWPDTTTKANQIFPENSNSKTSDDVSKY